jgi:hypothetical protein
MFQETSAIVSKCGINTKLGNAMISYFYVNRNTFASLTRPHRFIPGETSFGRGCVV